MFKTEVCDYFLKLKTPTGMEVTYIAKKIKHDLNGNPRYNITIVYETYAETPKTPLTSYNVVADLKHYHAMTYYKEEIEEYMKSLM